MPKGFLGGLILRVCLPSRYEQGNSLCTMPQCTDPCDYGRVTLSLVHATYPRSGVHW